MPYVRKTRDLFIVQMHSRYGWEDLTASYSRNEAKEHLKEYRINAPSYSYRMVRKYEKLASSL